MFAFKVLFALLNLVMLNRQVATRLAAEKARPAASHGQQHSDQDRAADRAEATVRRAKEALQPSYKGRQWGNLDLLKEGPRELRDWQWHSIWPLVHGDGKTEDGKVQKTDPTSHPDTWPLIPELSYARDYVIDVPGVCVQAHDAGVFIHLLDGQLLVLRGGKYRLGIFPLEAAHFQANVEFKIGRHEPAPIVLRNRLEVLRDRPPTLENLQGVLGTTSTSNEVAALAKALGEPGVLMLENDPKGTFDYDWPDHGLTVHFTKDVVSGVTAWPEGVGIKAYRGKLPAGVQITDSRPVVRQKLGEPTVTQELGQTYVGEKYEKQGVTIYYTLKDGKAGGIHHVTISAPTK